jgi:cytochrome c-type biogenesis protein CcsB
MSIEIFFQNATFLSLFFSMIIFWTQNTGSLEDPSKYKTFDRRARSDARSNEGVRQINLISPRGAGPLVDIKGTGDVTTGSLSTKGPSWQKTLGMDIGENLLFVSFILLTTQLIYRWYLSGHPPLSNLYESLLFLIWGTLTVFFLTGSTVWSLLGAESRREESSQDSDFRKFIGAIVSSVALFLQTFADWRLPDEMREIKPLIPALQSNWLLMHVSIMILSYAALLVGCLIAISYIILESTKGPIDNIPPRVTEEVPTLGSGGSTSNNPASTDLWSVQGEGGQRSMLPLTFVDPGLIASESSSKAIPANHLNFLDSLSYRVLAFGFPLLTLGILSGAVWANQAWGSYWSWDPKETWAFITWLIFAFYLHTRLQYGWEGRKSAYVASFGFFIVWICYLGVNLLGKGLHSYGWLS